MTVPVLAASTTVSWPFAGPSRLKLELLVGCSDSPESVVCCLTNTEPVEPGSGKIDSIVAPVGMLMVAFAEVSE